MLKHNPETIHRKVLRKVKKQFVTVTLAGGLVAALGTQAVAAEESGAAIPNLDDSAVAVDNTAAPAEDVAAPEETPVEEAPVEDTSTEEVPVDDTAAPVEETPTEEAPVDDAATPEEAPAEEPVDDTAAPEDTTEEEVTPEDEVPAPVIPETPERPEGTRRATIIHTNDLHGRTVRAGESDYDLGLGYIKSIADAYRELSDEVILLDAGDAVHGTTNVNLSEGENMIRLMNELGYKAVSPGNHEFNYGHERLAELNELADFNFIASNIENEAGEQLFDTFTEWQVFGERIGIIGVGSQDTTTTTHPNNIVGIEFTDEVAAVQSQVEALADEFNKFIVLSHGGFDVDQEIARQIPELELIIGGHSHTPVIGGTYVDGNDKTLITQAWEHGKLVGVIHLDFDAEGNIVNKVSQVITLADNFDAILEDLPASTIGDPADILKAGDVDEDPTVAAILDEIQAEIDEELSVVIGSSAVDLDGERATVRTGETNLGNLITDAIRDFTDTEVALINGGGIRASIPAGEVTVGDVLTVLPFINLVETVNLPGSVLLEALEYGLRLYPEQNGGLLHVSGMKYIVDATREEGDRIVYAEVNGEVLDPERVYNVALNDFLLAGGDGYEMFTDFEVELVTGELFSDVLATYIRNHEGPVSPEIEGRITISDEALSEAALAELIASITEGTPEVPGEDVPAEETPGENVPGVDKPVVVVPEDIDPSDVESIIDALIDLVGDAIVHELLNNFTIEELLALVEAYENNDPQAVQIIEEAQETVESGESLPDTATASWLIGLVGITALSSGLIVAKKDEN